MPEYVLCVACTAGTEAAFAASMRWQTDICALFPVFEREEHKNGAWAVKAYPLLPGYVFLYADRPIDVRRMQGRKHVKRVLQYGDGETNLRGEDRNFAEWVYRYNGRIALSRAWLVGDQTQIIDGPLKEYEGVIKKINRQRRSALVEIHIGQQARDVWLSFQWMTMRDGSLVEFNTTGKQTGRK